MMRYTHFVFDIDNTLINTTGAVLHGLQRALRDITGEHWDLSRLTPVLGIPGLDAFERLGIHSPEQIFQIYPRWEQYEQEYQYTAYLYEGIVPLLDFLKKRLRPGHHHFQDNAPVHQQLPSFSDIRIFSDRHNGR